jgi:two-component system nitrate/nitrite sensor histidine kinase NarX
MNEPERLHPSHTPSVWHAGLGIPLFALASVIVLLATSSLWAITTDTASSLPLALVSILFIAALALLVTLYLRIQKNLLTPLISLRSWAQDLKNNKTDVQVAAHGTSDFQHLANDINEIGRQFRVLSEDMQSQVSEKTEHIKQKARTLEIIYDVAASINVSRDLDDLLTRFLHTLKEVVNARAAVVRLVEDEENMRLVASTGLDEEVVAREQSLPVAACLCGSAYDKGTVQYQPDITKCDKIIGHSFFDDKNIGMIAVPLQYRDKTLGVYNLFVQKSRMKDIEEINELLTSIGRHLGMAIDKARLDDETNRLSIVEERTRLAHELHDSLAQTLASLRFQVRVLDENLRLGEEPAVWHELEKIENNLDEAYSELRELITHFRAPIDKRGLVPAVQHLVDRFRNQTGIHIFLQQEWHIVQLPPSIEVEALRIIQESLNNIRKHSQAHTVRVILRSTPQGDCRILIEDDGIGFDSSKDIDTKRDHYGLNIMTERAKRINGKFRIESDAGEGTRITLHFKYPTATQTTHESTNTVMIQPPSRQIGL